MTTTATTTPRINEIVEKYIKLRDRKDTLKKKYQEDTAAIDQMLEKCELHIMAQLNQLGLQSVNTGAGTAYKQVKTSATVADWPILLDWIKQTDSWPMLKKDVTKTVVEAYRNEHNDLPPGVNWREEVVLNIRRS